MPRPENQASDLSRRRHLACRLGEFPQSRLPSVKPLSRYMLRAGILRDVGMIRPRRGRGRSLISSSTWRRKVCSTPIPSARQLIANPTISPSAMTAAPTSPVIAEAVRHVDRKQAGVRICGQRRQFARREFPARRVELRGALKQFFDPLQFRRGRGQAFDPALDVQATRYIAPPPASRRADAAVRSAP